MHAAVISFPGSNADRDLAVAFRNAGARVTMVWHKDRDLPSGVDVIGVPGGFSFGDYLRTGAIAAQSPICRAVRAHAEKGGYVLGVCNGFQVLTETGLLPGALLRNAGIKFISRPALLRVVTSESAFTCRYGTGDVISVPVAHHDGNYYADEVTLDRLGDEDRIAFTYESNINGSVRDIAGILSENRRVLGLMPHPERCCDPIHVNMDGAALFSGLIDQLADA